MMTTAESINFRGRTLETVFRDGTLMSQNTDIVTGGDINMLLNAAQPTSYSFTSTTGTSFESRNINGDVSGSLTFDAQNDGNIEVGVENELDSYFYLSTDDLMINASGFAQFRGSSIDLSANSFTYTATNDIDIRSDSAVGDTVDFIADDDIDIKADTVNGSGENGLWSATFNVDFKAGGSFVSQAGPASDESYLLTAQDDLDVSSNLKISLSALLGKFEMDVVDNFDVQVSNDALFESADDMSIYVGGDFGMSAINVEWNLDEANFEGDNFDFSTVLGNFEMYAAVIDFWGNGGASFDADDQIQWEATGDINFRAFMHITIDNLLSLSADSISIEATEKASFNAAGGINFINSGTFTVRANNQNDFTFNGNNVIVDAEDGEVHITGGFLINQADDQIILNADKYTIETTLEESVFFSAGEDFHWVMNDGSFTSDDDIHFTSTSNEFLVNENINYTFTEEFFVYVGADALFDADVNTRFTAADNFKLLSKPDIYISAKNSQFDFARDFTVDVEGDIEITSGDDITYVSSNIFSIKQSSDPATIDDINFTGVNEEINLSGSYTQAGGSMILESGGDWTISSSDRILVGSTVSSEFTIGTTVTFDASTPESNIRIESNDLVSNSIQDIQFLGGQIDINSAESEYIDFTSANGNILLLSNNKSPIQWDAREEWNVTALAGLIVTSNDMIDNVGILFTNTDDVMSEIHAFTRNDAINIISLDTQTFSGKNIDLTSAKDITYTNFFPPANVGGVLIKSSGANHDGIYEDFTGISVRTSYPNGNILFSSPLGNYTVYAGEDLRNIILDARAFWTANTDMTFLAENGDIDILNKQGDVLFQADEASITFDTNANTELQATQSIHTLVGQKIRLTSTAPIDPQHPDLLSFEFSALEGNIVSRANASNPILFEGNDFDLTSNEDTYFLSSDNLPILTQTGGFRTDSNTGIYLNVDGGDIDMTASDSISVTSAKNFDTRITAGNNLFVTASNGDMSFTSGIDTIIRTDQQDILIRTADPNGDIFINSSGEIRFQADGTDDNIGASNVDGIFVDAPMIETYALDDTVFDAEESFTIGANTRPIITFEAGGNIVNYGVIFTSEGNINQEIGGNFQINTQGSTVFDTRRDLDFTATGGITIESRGTQLLGRNVVFETDQKMDVRANDIEINGERRVSVLSDELLSVNSRTLFTIDVLGELHTNVDDLADINVDNYKWTASSSYTLNTRGNVAFSNGPQTTAGSGTISIYGDNEVVFTSDQNQKYITRGDNANISFETIDTNSNIEVSTLSRLSDILFEVKGPVVETSVDDATFNTLGQIQITAPLDLLYDDSQSKITTTSAGDLNYQAERLIEIQADNGLTISAIDPSGADMDLTVEGFMFIQAWQDATFKSVTDSLTISTDFNITVSTEQDENGSISMISTRDIETNVLNDAFTTIEGSYTYSATGTFEYHVISNLPTGGLFLTTTGVDSNILFDSAANTQITGSKTVNINGGETYLQSDNGPATLNSLSSTIITNGHHHDIMITSEQGKVISTSGTSMDFTAAPTLSANTPSSRNGYGYIDFKATGVHPTDGYSIRIENDPTRDFSIVSPKGDTDFWAAGDIDFTINGNININSKSFDGKNSMELTALSPGGTIEFEAEETLLAINSNGYITYNAVNQIFMNPDDSLAFTALGTSDRTDYSSILIQTNHPSADLRMYTTDFLTADINFAAPGFTTMYSERSTTLLLLDDDDTASVGTYSVTSTGASINIAAENDLTIRETATGDIFFNDVGGEFFFSAGNDINLNARQEFEIDMDNTGAINLDAERDITFSAGDDIAFTSDSIEFNAEGFVRLVADDDITIDGVTVEFHTYDDIVNADSDFNQEVSFNALDDIIITGTGAASTVTFNLNPNRIIDFHDGLVLPQLAAGIASGDPCPATISDRSLFVDSTSALLCYCDGTTAFCMRLDSGGI